MYDLMGLLLLQCVSTLCSFTCNKERSVPFVTQFWRNSHGIFSDGKPHFVALFVVWYARILIVVVLLLDLCLFSNFSSNFSDEFAHQVIQMNFETVVYGKARFDSIYSVLSPYKLGQKYLKRMAVYILCIPR